MTLLSNKNGVSERHIGLEQHGQKSEKFVEAQFMTYATAYNWERSEVVANLSYRNSKLHTFRILSLVALFARRCSLSWYYDVTVGLEERMKGQDQYTNVERRVLLFLPPTETPSD